jgi:hypothetical protein
MMQEDPCHSNIQISKDRRNNSRVVSIWLFPFKDNAGCLDVGDKLPTCKVEQPIYYGRYGVSNSSGNE